MPKCQPCDRWFNTYHALEQHLDNAPVHQYTEECDYCNSAFRSQQDLHVHMTNMNDHPYCSECRRTFMNMNNLNQHLHSRAHQGSTIQCPWCKSNFTTASGLTVHLESGRCPSSGLNRQKLNTMIQTLDRNNIITCPMITLPGYTSQSSSIATERSWNGYGYECYLCNKVFTGLRGLNQHLDSPAHEMEVYKCPKGACGRTYKMLSGLVMHFESESCGVMRFRAVQEQARGGIENMVGRMIGY